MKEYGGYLELECFSGSEYYQDVIALNSGRNCLKYLLEVREIKKIFLPFFLCDSVINVCQENGVDVSFYHIDSEFRPQFNMRLLKNEYLYIVNFYGQLSAEYILALKERYENIIVDNVQSFFCKPLDHIDTIYVLRKWFGVPDGAYLSTECRSKKEYPLDISGERIRCLIGRFEENASKFYEAHSETEQSFEHEPIKRMSKLTHNLLRAIDYQQIKEIRKRNFSYLHKELVQYNLLGLKEPEVPFYYPLWIKGGDFVRKELCKKKIYIPTLWPNVISSCTPQSLEYEFALNILPLPIDQRYDEDDMKYIVDILKTYLK